MTTSRIGFTCKRCSAPSFWWWVPDEVWAAVMDVTYTAGCADLGGGMICLLCFIEIAKRKGITDLPPPSDELVSVLLGDGGLSD